MPLFRLALIALLLLSGAAYAQAGPGEACRGAIAAAERAAGIPAGLLAAIGQVESGRRMADGSIAPWPWSIDAEGEGHVFATKAEAIAAVRALQGEGVRSIDIGCLQVNLLHHPAAFATLDQGFDPEANAAFAARFLVQLHAQTGDWPAAAALYHSATPALAAEYRRRVMAAWPGAAAEMGAPLVNVAMRRPWGAGLTPGGAPLAHALPNANSGGPRLLPLPPGQAGRGLAAYRALPIPLAIAPGAGRYRG